MPVEDYLFTETDDTCAICGIRGRQILTIHHIDGNSTNNTYDNMIILCHNCHHSYHQNKGLSRHEIELRKRHLILKTLTEYGLSAMKIADRNQVGVVALPFLLYHLVGLKYMRQEETQMAYDNIPVTVKFSITDDGRALLTKWFS